MTIDDQTIVVRTKGNQPKLIIDIFYIWCQKFIPLIWNYVILDIYTHKVSINTHSNNSSQTSNAKEIYFFHKVTHKNRRQSES